MGLSTFTLPFTINSRHVKRQQKKKNNAVDSPGRTNKNSVCVPASPTAGRMASAILVDLEDFLGSNQKLAVATKWRCIDVATRFHPGPPRHPHGSGRVSEELSGPDEPTVLG